MSVWPLIAKLFNRVFGTALEADSVRMQFTEHKRPRGSRVWKVILGDLGTEVGRREKVVAVERIRVAEDGLGMGNEEEEDEEGDEDGDALGLGEEEEGDDADMSEGDATTDEGSPISISSDEPTSDEIEASSTPFGVEPASLSAPITATLAETTDHASPTTTSSSPTPPPDHPSLATTKPASPTPSSHSPSPSPSLSPPPATAKGTNPYTPATPLTREEFRQLWNPCECTGWCTCPSSKFLERAKTAGEDGKEEGVGRGYSGGVGAAERTPAHLGAAALEHPLRQAGESDCRGAC